AGIFVAPTDLIACRWSVGCLRRIKGRALCKRSSPRLLMGSALIYNGLRISCAYSSLSLLIVSHLELSGFPDHPRLFNAASNAREFWRGEVSPAPVRGGSPRRGVAWV